MKKLKLSDGREIEVVTVKVKHMMAAKKMYKDEMEQEVYIVSQCSGLGMQDMEELDMPDYSLLVSAIFGLGK